MVKAYGLLHPQRDTHEGLKLACKELDSLLSKCRAVSQSGAPVASDERHLARVAHHAIDGLTLLEATIGVLLHDADNPGRLKTPKALRYAVARFVCNLAPRHQLPLSAKGLNALGRFLLERYAPLYAGVIECLRAQDEREQRRASLLSMPFGVS
jgi:hypothetical protein